MIAFWNHFEVEKSQTVCLITLPVGHNVWWGNRWNGSFRPKNFQSYCFWDLKICHWESRQNLHKNENMMSIWMITRVWVGRPKQWSGVLPLSSFPPIMASPACYTSHQTLGHQTPDPRSPCRQILQIISEHSHCVATGDYPTCQT